MERFATRLTLAGALAYLLAATVPYAVADPAEVSVYYGVGVAGPLYLLAPAGIGLIAAFSGAKRRSDPPTMAGVALVMGVTTALLSALWAFPAGGVVGGMTSVEPWFDFHRWTVLLSALVLTAGCAGYAAAVLGVVGSETKGV